MTSSGQGHSAAPPAPDMPDELHVRHLLLRLVGLAILIGIVAAAISSVPGLDTIRERFAHATGVLVGITCLLKVGSCLSNVVAFRDVFCRRMGWRFSYQLAMAEQATNVLLPTGGAGGLALGAWALRQGGMSTAHIARRSVTFFVLTSIPNFIVVGAVGVLLLTGAFGQVPIVPTAVFTGMAFVAGAVTALLPVGVRRLPEGGRPGSLRRRLRTGAGALAEGISDTGTLLRTRRGPAILGSLGYLGFDIAAMLVAFAAIGASPRIVPLIFAYTVGQLGGLIPLPGGIGGTDGGLIGATVLYGSTLVHAAAAVLIYRVFQLGVPAILGTVAFFQLRRTLSRSNAPAADCAGLAEPPVELSARPSAA
jgi:uncharacterized membrane protein YbhN (UPF0104 family)